MHCGYCSFPDLRGVSLTCSSSSLSRRSWDSSCLLWSSRICIRVSRRVLCWRRTRASAKSSSSCCPPTVGEPRPSSPASVSIGTDAASSCFHLSRLYSLCSTLGTHSGWRMDENSQANLLVQHAKHNRTTWRIVLTQIEMHKDIITWHFVLMRWIIWMILLNTNTLNNQCSRMLMYYWWLTTWSAIFILNRSLSYLRFVWCCEYSQTLWWRTIKTVYGLVMHC